MRPFHACNSCICRYGLSMRDRRMYDGTYEIYREWIRLNKCLYDSRITSRDYVLHWLYSGYRRECAVVVSRPPFSPRTPTLPNARKVSTKTRTAVYVRSYIWRITKQIFRHEQIILRHNGKDWSVNFVSVSVQLCRFTSADFIRECIFRFKINSSSLVTLLVIVVTV